MIKFDPRALSGERRTKVLHFGERYTYYSLNYDTAIGWVNDLKGRSNVLTVNTGCINDPLLGCAVYFVTYTVSNKGWYETVRSLYPHPMPTGYLGYKVEQFYYEKEEDVISGNTNGPTHPDEVMVHHCFMNSLRG